jgi:hypothetical protein
VVLEDDVKLALAGLAALLGRLQHPGDVAVELPHVVGVGFKLAD